MSTVNIQSLSKNLLIESKDNTREKPVKTVINGVCLVFLKCESFLKFKGKEENRK